MIPRKSVTFLLFILITGLCGCFSKNNAADSALPKVELQHDFQILRTTLVEAHPGLYWYSDSASMNAYFDSTYKLINEGMTRTDFLKLLFPIIANVRCGHTSLQFNRRHLPPAFTSLLPFNFLCADNKVYISKSLDGEQYNGWEIRSINNIKVADIIAKLFSSISADGYNKTSKYFALNVGALREGYALYFGQPDTFHIEVAKPGKVGSFFLNIEGRKPSDLQSLSYPAVHDKMNLGFIDSIHTAVFTLNTLEFNTQVFHDSLEKLFHAIAEHRAENLVIDMRNNGGGTNDNVSTSFFSIANAPFLHLRAAETTTSRYTYRKYFTNASSFNNRSPAAGGRTRSVATSYSGTKQHDPVKRDLFTGKVYVLTSGQTFSAASEFVALAHFTKRAIIVGEETGGCYYGATGGNYINLLLPASQFEVRIPTIRIFTAVKEDFSSQLKGRGTMPDIFVPNALENLSASKDPQLMKTFQLIEAAYANRKNTQ